MKDIVRYRIAVENDILQIKTLLNSVNGDLANFDYKDFIVASKYDEIVGCIRLKKLDKDCFELSSLAVKPEYKNQKIGSHLIKKIVDNKTKKIFLLCFEDISDFYKKNGFKEIGVTELSDVLTVEYLRVKNLLLGEKKIVAMLLPSPPKRIC